MNAVTYADVFQPRTDVGVRIYNIALVVLGSVFIALMAQIRIPLPFSPVPVTGQTFAILLIGMLYGRHRALATVSLYLMEGIAGLPVFAGGVGLSYVLGSTGGYIIGFLFAAYLLGIFAEWGWDRRFVSAFFAMFIGSVVILTLGTIYLATFVGWKSAFVAGFLPFIGIDIIKSLIAATLLPAGWRIIRK